MERTPSSTNIEGDARVGVAYPCALVEVQGAWTGAALQFPSLATGGSRGEVERLLSEQVALYLLDCSLGNVAPDAPWLRNEVDLRDYREEGVEPKVVYVAPARVSIGSVAIERALRAEDLTYAELARRMDAPRSLISRITNPFYFGHTLKTLTRVAQALGRDVHIELAPKRR